MARINGINSDYKKMGDGIVEVSPQPSNLELKLFLCPYGEPNQLEEESGVCTGTEAACPHPAPKNGHAMVALSQSEGIRLQTDGNNQLRLFQTSDPSHPGSIHLNPTNAGEAKVNGDFRVDGEAEFRGDFQVRTSNGNTILIDVSSSTVTVRNSSGARIVLKSNGDMDLHTSGNNGNVKVHGNLLVTGTVTPNSP